MDNLADLQAVLSTMRAEAAANAEVIKARLAQQDASIQALGMALQGCLEEVRSLRQDIQEFKTEVRVEFQVIRTEMQALRTDMEKVRGECHATRADLEHSLNAVTWKMIAAILAAQSVTAALVYHLT